VNAKLTKLDNWVKEIVVDPLGKEPLTVAEDGCHLLSSYGRKYPITNGIYDLRFLNNETTPDQKEWNRGQRFYEDWSKSLVTRDSQRDYFAEIEGVREVYQELPLEGRCLDVGGHDGRLRRFLSLGQEYVVCDPFINGYDELARQPNLIKAYPVLLEPVNFICCDAEFLPFRTAVFRIVHMRSVIDHFLSPELALNEAYRVLESGGDLMVGTFVRGGKSGRLSSRAVAKELARAVLVSAGLERFKDYHVWHPTFRELTALISECGFEVEKVHWQKGYDETVCYLRARKRSGLSRRA
jgi:SAM-dependent methyltransferase